MLILLLVVLLLIGSVVFVVVDLVCELWRQQWTLSLNSFKKSSFCNILKFINLKRLFKICQSNPVKHIKPRSIPIFKILLWLFSEVVFTTTTMDVFLACKDFAFCYQMSIQIQSHDSSQFVRFINWKLSDRPSFLWILRIFFFSILQLIRTESCVSFLEIM